jgi:hypothetical protein
MKKLLIKFLIVFVSWNAISIVDAPKAIAQVSVSFQAFYDDLSPYGNWVYHSRYGYVWVPSVRRGFTPYSSNGHWVYTRAGWTWVSNYRWGWAAFHYGRWFRDRHYGWVWVPDTQWAPAWVTWRSSQGYYGWAPIGPGISIDIAFGNSYNVPYDEWRFVRERDFGRDNMENYYVSTNYYTTIINNSVVINNIQGDNSQNIRYNAGPDRADVERRAGKTFSPVNIRESNKPEQSLSKNELIIYKPRVQKEDNAGRKPAPAKTTTWQGSNTDVQPERKPPVPIDKVQPVKETRKEPVQPERKPAVPLDKVQPTKETRKDNVQPERKPPVPLDKVQPTKETRKDNVQPERKPPVPLDKVQPVKETRKEPVQPVRETRKEPVQPVKETRKEPVQPVRETRKEPVQPVRETRKEPVQPVKENRKEPVQPVRETRKEPVQPVRETRKDPVQQPVKEQPRKDNPPRKK